MQDREMSETAAARAEDARAGLVDLLRRATEAAAQRPWHDHDDDPCGQYDCRGDCPECC